MLLNFGNVTTNLFPNLGRRQRDSTTYDSYDHLVNSGPVGRRSLWRQYQKQHHPFSIAIADTDNTEQDPSFSSHRLTARDRRHV